MHCASPGSRNFDKNFRNASVNDMLRKSNKATNCVRNAAWNGKSDSGPRLKYIPTRCLSIFIGTIKNKFARAAGSLVESSTPSLTATFNHSPLSRFVVLKERTTISSERFLVFLV